MPSVPAMPPVLALSRPLRALSRPLRARLRGAAVAAAAANMAVSKAEAEGARPAAAAVVRSLRGRPTSAPSLARARWSRQEALAPLSLSRPPPARPPPRSARAGLPIHCARLHCATANETIWRRAAHTWRRVGTPRPPPPSSTLVSTTACGQGNSGSAHALAARCIATPSSSATSAPRRPYSATPTSSSPPTGARRRHVGCRREV